MRFNSILGASLAVVVIIASIVCSSDAQCVNGTTMFGSCANFSIQGGAGVSFAGGQNNIHSGSVGDSPSASITGSYQLGTNYTTESNSAAAQNCTADVGIAYLYLAGVNCTSLLAASDLTGITLYPGVYCTTAGVFTLNAGALTLDAQGNASAVFIFQMATTLTTGINTNMVLQNGTQATNVYWQIGSSATLGNTSYFIGQIFAYASITVGTAVKVCGRLFAQAAVTFAGTDQGNVNSTTLVPLPARCPENTKAPFFVDFVDYSSAYGGIDLFNRKSR